jgi:hypothetical protein
MKSFKREIEKGPKRRKNANRKRGKIKCKLKRRK